METEEIQTSAADVVEIPAAPAPESGAGDNTRKPDSSAAKGFDSFFDEAISSAAVAQSEETEIKTGTETEKPASDDKIPLAAEEETVEDEEPADDKGEKSDDETDLPTEEKKTSRGQNYKDAIQRAETAETQKAEIEAEKAKTDARLEKLDKQFEKLGGFEAVEEATEFLALAVDKTKVDEFLSEINKLPHAGIIQRKIVDSVLEMPANRVYSVNQVLKEDFGLQKEINQGLMEKTFEMITEKLNSDPTEFENFLDRELEFFNSPEKKTARLEAEIERLKNNPPPAQTNEEAQNAANTESQADFALRIQTKHNEFFDRNFAEVVAPKIAEFGFEAAKTDSPQMKADKQRVAEMVQMAVHVRLAQAKAIEPVVENWIKGNGSEDSSFFKAAARNYKNVMRLESEEFLKSISRINSARKPAAAKETEKEIPAKNGDSAASAQKVAATLQPQSKIVSDKKQSKGVSFDAAFDAAKNQAGA